MKIDRSKEIPWNDPTVKILHQVAKEYKDEGRGTVYLINSAGKTYLSNDQTIITPRKLNTFDHPTEARKSLRSAGFAEVANGVWNVRLKS